MKRILIIEDDTALNNGIALALKNGSCTFAQAYTLGKAKIKMAEQVFDLLILDINMLDGKGLTFLSDISNR